MMLRNLLKPGINIKRWILLGIVGVSILVFGIFELINKEYHSLPKIVLSALIIVLGALIIYVAIIQIIKFFIILVNTGSIDVAISSKKFEDLIYEKRVLIKGPKIVVIGGGTGLSTMLRGLKKYTNNITAIVTVADDGGGSGVLREDLGILPPGDIRNCILALADTEPLMDELLQYRFKDGRLKDQSFGNLFLAAMDGISNNFEEAVQKMSSVLAVTGRVIPVTLDNMTLKAKLKNGNIIDGESNIPKGVIDNKSPIDEVFIEPTDARALKEALVAINEADAVILGPGSLYTSIIPNILVKEIRNALYKTKSIRIYVSNIMTQPGESDNYTVNDHIKAINRHAKGKVVDYVLVNTGKISSELELRYRNDNSNMVIINEEEIKKQGIGLIKSDFVKIGKGHIRHDTEKLATILVETIMEKKLFNDKKKIGEYFYLSQRLKENKKNN
ncbi:gluconeogenesis factor YvcK family protein [Clostridium estertheticum]|uniref:Putative gluconeogenesis factor n=1 Tax=Clostridium estertheticum TaxID=238834 RepID=A0A7Y3ST30_9CLOT|nr:YvcK family protein [Clostridium estertheticum]MBW9170202.1 YvcK family protein [Clostridium estertheticum]MBX4263598.1 YvcK family protein [Clostridium estertheticum]NNU74828.1 YvcK family protein [Clostridium estertheticum]WBL47291.1 YvcK family protein [Clostridium estertheticum]WLC75456.1 YvcK family protein [Clostridium estertheticum]